MGFGTYDESEQRDQDVDGDEDAGVNVHDDDEGELSFESDASTDQLVDQLQEMKDDDDD